MHAGNHGVPDVSRREIEDSVQQHRQFLRQVTADAGVGNDVTQFLGGGCRVQVVDWLDADRAQQRVGGLVEEGDQPSENGQVDERRTGHPARHRSGVGDGQVLRIELTEQHLDCGGDHQGGHGPNRDADGRRQSDSPQQDSE